MKKYKFIVALDIEEQENAEDIAAVERYMKNPQHRALTEEEIMLLGTKKIEKKFDNQ